MAQTGKANRKPWSETTPKTDPRCCEIRESIPGPKIPAASREELRPQIHTRLRATALPATESRKNSRQPQTRTIRQQMQKLPLRRAPQRPVLHNAQPDLRSE